MKVHSTRWALSTWLSWSRFLAYMELTPATVVVKTGFLRAQVKTIPLNRVADVIYRAGPIGRMLDFGDVYIESAGAASREGLPNVLHAREFREAVLAASPRG